MPEETVAEERIAVALLALLDEKEFSRISITEITERAGVSRVSYYRHFSSKEDILLRHSEYVLERIVADMRRGNLRDGRDFWKKLYAELSETNLVINMQKAGLENGFFMIFEKKIETIYTSVLGVDISAKMNLVMMEFVIGGLMALLRKPMLESRSISPDDVSAFLKLMGEQSIRICSGV